MPETKANESIPPTDSYPVRRINNKEERITMAEHEPKKEKDEVRTVSPVVRVNHSIETDEESPISLSVWTPTADGTFPVIVFAPGLKGFPDWGRRSCNPKRVPKPPAQAGVFIGGDLLPPDCRFWSLMRAAAMSGSCKKPRSVGVHQSDFPPKGQVHRVYALT